jgi:SAM-dependent methyltransferase
MLYGLMKDIVKHLIFRSGDKAHNGSAFQSNTTIAASGARKVLNVGGNSKEIALPSQYVGWQHVLLDIDPRGNPDVVCDARTLTDLPAGQYDAVYCSHNLEHYYRHDAVKVLAGFRHVLKNDGFVHILVPDMSALMKKVVVGGLDIDDLLYNSSAGPIHVVDVIYGLASEIERSGNDFFAHKTGFTEKSLRNRLEETGFPYVFTWICELEIGALAFNDKPTQYASDLFNLERRVVTPNSPG